MHYVDDIIDSGGTIINAVEALKNGAIMLMFITHVVLKAMHQQNQEIKKKKLITIDTIDNSNKIKNNNKIEILSILLMVKIKRISNPTSGLICLINTCFIFKAELNTFLKLWLILKQIKEINLLQAIIIS